EYKFVDDVEYCKTYGRVNSTSKGGKLIERDLRLKGIDFNIVSSAVEEIGDQSETVKAIAEKYMKNKEPTKENSAKLYKYILSKGFGYEQASYAVKCVKGEDWNEY
ncbi:MAG: RecX family transcriptional regulator, partial [Clostridia bacterium]|nr:RecX family transcriptional regulator [Clostridia bacterium]